MSHGVVCPELEISADVLLACRCLCALEYVRDDFSEQ